MKRSDLQQKIKDRIEMRIRESHYASDTTDYERWAFAHFLADELISLIEKQGMLPPAYMEKTAPGWPAIRKNEWEPEEEST